MDDIAQYVLIRLAGQLCGLPAGRITEMLQLPELTPTPKSPPNMRGVFLHRDRTVPVFDLRRCLGIQTLEDELVDFRETLCRREKDLHDWLDELEASVRESRPPEVAKDPTQGEFGKWFGNYWSENPAIANHILRFDAPYRRTHELRVEVDLLVRDGREDVALERIEETRGRELAEMIHLFEGFGKLLEESVREIAIVLTSPGGEPLGYCVDRVESVQAVDSSEEATGGSNQLSGPGITTVVHGKERDVIHLIDGELLLDPGSIRIAV